MLLKVIHYIMKNNIYKTIKNTIDRIELDPEKYRHTFVNPDKDFTRDRKQTLSSVVRTGLLRSGSTQNQDLRLVYGVGDDRPSVRDHRFQPKMTTDFNQYKCHRI